LRFSLRDCWRRCSLVSHLMTQQCLLSAPLILELIVAIATLIPAQRAASLDPASAVRFERGTLKRLAVDVGCPRSRTPSRMGKPSDSNLVGGCGSFAVPSFHPARCLTG